jgi:magnesium-transporting ATPase (P-type)
MKWLLLGILVVSGAITWTAIRMSYFFIDLNRNYASSSYPGDLTIAQEVGYLLILTLIVLVVQFIVIIVFKIFLKEKSKSKTFNLYAYGIQILSLSIFFFSIYFYLFGK